MHPKHAAAHSLFVHVRLLCGLLLFGCSAGEDPPSFAVPDRPAGVRAPLSAPCDPMDETRCLLPFPSSVFTVRDPSTKTGLRVAIAADSLEVADDPAALLRADGFSQVTPLVTAFYADIPPLPVAKVGTVRCDSCWHSRMQVALVKLFRCVSPSSRTSQQEAEPSPSYLPIRSVRSLLDRIM
jgi:hypothetical protein